MPKTSLVWHFFERFKEGDREKTKCKICSHSAFYHKNTTNLKDHLKRKHPLQLTEHEQEIRPQEINSNQTNSSPPIAPQPSEGNGEVPIAPPPTKRPRQLRLYAASSKEVNRDVYDQGLVRMMVTDYQPLSMVENKGFNEFVKLLAPNYDLPSRKTVTEKLLPNEHQRVHKSLEEMIDSVSHLSITSDLWTSDSSKCYITITGHFVWEFQLKSCILGTEEVTVNHTALNIGEAIIKILSKFPGSLSKTSVVVTDNAANIKKAVTDCLKKIHHPCVAHTLNLSVQEAIKKCTGLESVLNKCRDLNAHFKHSNVASYKLKETQELMGLPILKLKKDMPTRWNSILFMIERFSEVRVPLSASLIALINAPENLDASEWATIDDIIPLLKPVHKITEELSGEDYPTLSRIIPLIRGLQHLISSKHPTTETGLNLKNFLIDILGRRLGGAETHKSIALSTLLDPRFKKTGFGLIENANTAQRWLTEYLADEIERSAASASNDIETVENNNTILATGNDEDDLWKLFDNKVITETSCSTPTSSATIQVKQYLEMPLLHRKENPLDFWKKHSQTFPILCKLALKFLCVPATSVPSERVFSKAGFLCNQRRNRLAPKKLDEIIFLNKNIALK